MSIDKIIKNNLINKNLLESIKGLSKDDKTKLLNIFNFVDENEKDNQKGIITTDEALNSFLKEVKNSIGEKYDKILDTIGLQHLKNDKNINGIIDIEDFSEEELIKLETNNLLEVFAIENLNNQKWTPEIAKIFSAILHNANLDEKRISTSFNIKDSIRNIVYDVESKTLKRSEHSSDVNEYNHLWMYKYDDNGLLIEQIMFDRGHARAEDGKKIVLGLSAINCLAEEEGFPSLMKKEWSEDFVNKIKEIIQNNQVGDKIEYKYDEKGKIIEQIIQTQIDEEIIISKTVNSLDEEIIRDIYGNFISHKKELFLTETENIKKSIIENYDENGKLIYTTTKIFLDYFNEPKTIKDKNGNDIKVLSEEQIIKEYPNGEIEEEIFYEEVF